MGYQPPQGYPPQGGQWPEQGQGQGYPPPPPPGYPGGQPYPGAPQAYYGAMPGAYPVEQPDTRGGVAIAALILGILGLVSFIFWFCSAPLGIAGIITGVLGRGSTKHKTMATVGLVLSIIGIVATVGFTAFGVYAINNNLIPFLTPTP